MMGPPADARRRSALMPEVAHVELVPRDFSALEHPQHLGQGIDLNVREPKFLCRLEVLCKHMAPRVAPVYDAPHTIYTRSHRRRKLVPGWVNRPNGSISRDRWGSGYPGRHHRRMISANSCL